jgi:hypothetical protein
MNCEQQDSTSVDTLDQTIVSSEIAIVCASRVNATTRKKPGHGRAFYMIVG